MLAASIVFAPVSAVTAIWARFSFDACTGQCNLGLGEAAFWVAAAGPAVVVAGLVVALILRRRARKTGWPVAAAALGLQALLLTLSLILTSVALSK